MTVIRAFLQFRRYIRPYRGVLVFGALLEIVDTALAVAQPWPLKVVVDNVLKAPGNASAVDVPLLGGISGSPKTLLADAVVSLLLIVALSALTDYWSTTLMAGTGERLGNDIRESLFAHLHTLSLRYHGEHQVGDLASRVSADVDRIQDMMVQTLAILLPNVLLAGGMVTVMFAVDPQFAALSLAAFPLLAFAVRQRLTLTAELYYLAGPVGSRRRCRHGCEQGTVGLALSDARSVLRRRLGVSGSDGR